MENSEFIAMLIGPVALAFACMILINRAQFEKMIEQFIEHGALIVFSGVLTLVAGIAIVQVHNIWVGDWRVIVTIFGWLAVAGGIFRIVFPNAVAAMAEGFIHNRTMTTAGAVLMLAIGGYLTAMGFGARL